jgi:hypothetical protein
MRTAWMVRGALLVLMFSASGAAMRAQTPWEMPSDAHVFKGFEISWLLDATKSFTTEDAETAEKTGEFGIEIAAMNYASAAGSPPRATLRGGTISRSGFSAARCRTRAMNAAEERGRVRSRR